MRNTNRIDITGTASGSDTYSANAIYVDETLGRLGPGATRERRGASEIEIRVSVTPGYNAMPPYNEFPLNFTYLGTGRADVVRVGTRGLDMNGDGDVDIRNTLTPFASYFLVGSGGPDVLSGAGSRAAGAAIEVTISLIGNGGNDRLLGGKSNDWLVGGFGADKLFGGAGDDLFTSPSPDGADTLSGGEGTDTVHYGGRSTDVNVSLDGVANDGAPGELDKALVENVVGGAGNDTLVANIQSGTTNVLTGGLGNDTFDTFDFLSDTVYGDDSAYTDETIIDTTDGVEHVTTNS